MQVIFERWHGEPLSAEVFCQFESGEKASPVFSGCVALYAWLHVNGWKQASNLDHGNEKYTKGVAVYTKGVN